MPGSVYIEMAFAALEQDPQAGAHWLKNIEFQRMCILPESGDQTLHQALTSGTQGEREFTCGSEPFSGTSADADHLNVRMRIPQPAAVEALEQPAPVDLDLIRTRCTSEVEGADFYAELARNGNFYGPAFQNVRRLWKGDQELIAYLEESTELESQASAYQIHPAFLDACMHVLPALVERLKQTFILVGIDQVQVFDFPANACWCHAEAVQHSSDAAGALIGNVSLFDGAGKTLIRLLGVRFHYLDYDGGVSSTTSTPPTIALSATFTAEPVEDALRFWMSQLQTPFQVKFAPYNQVFQQLLDASSLLSRNEDGLNVILLKFDDWIKDRKRLAGVDAEERERQLAGKERYQLPNGVEVAHLNAYETDYVHKEIFEDRSYLKNGITLNDGDCVIDVGANIGLFTLFVQQECKGPTIYAFEPSPPVYELLAANASLYGSNIKTFNCGLSDCSKEATFTFYEKSSVFSTFNADEEDDSVAVKAVIQNVLRKSSIHNSEDLDEFVDELFEGRLESQSYECSLKSLSDVIRENDIQEIDLLKIDAEKSEKDILLGIDELDWPKIRQIVLEVHDRQGSLLEEVAQLLRGRGFEVAVEEEELLKDSGLYNVFAIRCSKAPSALVQTPNSRDQQDFIRENVEHLIQALKPASERSTTPCLLCVCPPAPHVVAEQMAFYQEMENLLLAECENVNHLYGMSESELQSYYPVANYFDEHGNQLGHVPYTPSFYASLGTCIARKIQAIQRAPYKVVVLDCDQTLWKGVCGEDGPDGIEIDAPRKALQEFMVSQSNAGMLLCLCSKNNEEDVTAVFDHHADMPLKREHLVSSRVNWGTKSANIRSLAEELQLGLDSFIFVDDNPVECAEVMAGCPEVLTLQLPQDAGNYQRFLDHVWAFDQMKVTDEDKQRTSFYKENINRDRFRAAALTLRDFIDGLELTVTISTVTPTQWPRVGQLTQRTNQFNCTTIRRTEAEVRKLCESGALECRVVEASDRFGDHGLVGAILFETDSNTLHVDSFMLSCRVLGRGVEHQMMARLGQIGLERDLSQVEVPCKPTPKNRPALDFLNAIGLEQSASSDQETLFCFPAAYLERLVYDPGQDETPTPQKGKTRNGAPSRSAGLAHLDQSSHIATHLNQADRILDAITSQVVKERPAMSEDYVAASNQLERSIARVWQDVLGLQSVGIRDNFFDVGGNSLKGVQLIARLKRDLKVDIAIVNLFESPTVQAMAKMLGNGSGSDQVMESAQASEVRGARRRAKRRTRKRETTSNER